MNIEALFHITYGLYIVCSGNKETGNGFVSNTVFQVTAEPAKFATCCNKNNFTCGLIDKFNAFSVSILNQQAKSETIGQFGYKTGKDVDKMTGVDLTYGITGVPIVMNDSIAYIECKVVDKIDVGTHILFIGELIDAQVIDATAEPLTYAYYRQVRKGVAPKNAPTYIDKSNIVSKPAKTGKKAYTCTACGYIYDENVEEMAFGDLPSDWKCPLCGADKEDFTEN